MLCLSGFESIFSMGAPDGFKHHPAIVSAKTSSPLTPQPYYNLNV